ncbi:hypothetical protein EVG20_g6158 [Dentipellis fragilis]|uniref:tripeptidyl-peptidase II n=1 Tax=Dentipellis fragilis TaxID=205917 RepID=A0A4Y9YRZ2_9AGAM|nr:hypothetical protein EVG20_g6158 [Dentipellis fragilis]
MRVHERREEVPSGFVQNGPAPADQVLKLRISLVQNNSAGLEDALYAASASGSGQYGQNLSKDQVNTFVAPSPDTVSAVNAWLSSHNLTSTTISPAGDWLRVQTTVEQANNLLDANYTTFTHQKTGKKTIRTHSYSIPASLHGHVNLVYPTTMFPIEARRSPVASTVARRSVMSSLTQRDIPISCNLTVTPACIQDTYGLPATLATQPGNRIGVAGFDNEYVDEADLKLFLQMYRPDLNASTTFEVKFVDGGQNPQNQSLAGAEAVLDIQWTVGLASGVPVTFYSVGETNGVGGIEDWIDLANALLSEDTPPQVFTTSYSWNEPNVTEPIARSLCNMYAQLGARGTTVIFSSGDGGVDGGSLGGGQCPDFVPTFPSTCPLRRHTSVGATVFSPPEEAAPYSSGGFSNVFARPSYQDATVSKFLTQLGDTYKGRYNASGCGFPDISAQGADMVSVYRGRVTGLGGTSYSAPIIASTVALLNDELIAAGKSTLGFLNPLIYANSDAFSDVARGDNPGCGTNGFTAVEGWDPLSGVGTPIYSALRKAAVEVRVGRDQGYAEGARRFRCFPRNPSSFVHLLASRSPSAPSLMSSKRYPRRFRDKPAMRRGRNILEICTCPKCKSCARPGEGGYLIERLEAEKHRREENLKAYLRSRRTQRPELRVDATTAPAPHASTSSSTRSLPNIAEHRDSMGDSDYGNHPMDSMPPDPSASASLANLYENPDDPDDIFMQSLLDEATRSGLELAGERLHESGDAATRAHDFDLQASVSPEDFTEPR